MRLFDLLMSTDNNIVVIISQGEDVFLTMTSPRLNWNTLSRDLLDTRVKSITSPMKNVLYVKLESSY